MHTRIEFFEVLGIAQYGSIIVAQAKFAYADGIHGYTGGIFESISKEQLKYYTSRAYKEEYYAGILERLGEKFVKENGGRRQLKQRILHENDGIYLGQDTSHNCNNPKKFDIPKEILKKVLGHIPVTYSCIGGGRMFTEKDLVEKAQREWKYIHNLGLLQEIQEYENKEI